MTADPITTGMVDRWARDHAARLLGLDTETMERRLLLGERVEFVHNHLDDTELSEFPRSFGALSLERWLTRPVPPVIVPPSPSAAPGVVPVPRNTRQDGDDTETETADEGFWRRLATREDFDPYGLER